MVAEVIVLCALAQVSDHQVIGVTTSCPTGFSKHMCQDKELFDCFNKDGFCIEDPLGTYYTSPCCDAEPWYIATMVLVAIFTTIFIVFAVWFFCAYEYTPCTGGPCCYDSAACCICDAVFLRCLSVCPGKCGREAKSFLHSKQRAT